MQKTIQFHLFFILFILFGCEKENLQNENSPKANTNQTSPKIEKLSLDELSKDKQFDAISSIFKLNETFTTAKKWGNQKTISKQ